MYPSNSHSDFHRAAPHMGIPLIGQLSLVHLPDRVAQLLATTMNQNPNIEANSMHSSPLS